MKMNCLGRLLDRLRRNRQREAEQLADEIEATAKSMTERQAREALKRLAGIGTRQHKITD